MTGQTVINISGQSLTLNFDLNGGNLIDYVVSGVSSFYKVAETRIDEKNLLVTATIEKGYSILSNQYYISNFEVQYSLTGEELVQSKLPDTRRKFIDEILQREKEFRISIFDENNGIKAEYL